MCVRTLTCGHARPFDGRAAALHLPFVRRLRAQKTRRRFLSCHFIITSALFLFFLRLSPALHSSSPLLSCLSYLAPLFYFSNSVPLIHFYGSLCSCLLSQLPPPLFFLLSLFFLFDLNFLISSLIYVTPLGFISHSPRSSSDALHCSSASWHFCVFSFPQPLSKRNVFSPPTPF